MSKQHRITIRKFKVEPSTIDLSALKNPEIIKEDDGILLIFTKDLTNTDYQEINKLKEQLELTEKEEYAQMNPEDKQLYIEKKLGLI